MLPNFDFVSNVRRFLQGDWLNAGLVIKYWACTKPPLVEVAAVTRELEDALSKESADAWMVKGIIIYYHLEEKEYKRDSFIEAFDYFKKAAAHGKAVALQILGFFYERGKLGKLDYSELAFGYDEILQRTDSVPAERALAANNLGYCYAYGFGVLQNYETAKKYYEEAVALGEVSALSEIGLLYEGGKGVTKDCVVARSYYEKAAALGDARAFDWLGLLYEHGLGVTLDYAIAAKYYAQAVRLGDVSALRHLGFLYVNGFGVPENFVQAEKYYYQAVNLGDPHAALKLVELYGNVSAWGGSYLVVRLDSFAKPILQRRQANYASARILGGNFADLSLEGGDLCLEKHCNLVVRMFLQFFFMTRHLIQVRERNVEHDYQLHRDDFEHLVACGSCSKDEFKRYLEEHRLTRRIFHSNAYLQLRNKLEIMASGMASNEFDKAVRLYNRYLHFRQTQAVAPSEYNILERLLDVPRHVELVKRDSLPVVVAKCRFFSSSLEIARDHQVIELQPMV